MSYNWLEACETLSKSKSAKKKTATKRDPAKWARAKSQAKARMGGKHSARAMQLAVQIYKKMGGTYSGKKPTAKSNSLKKWSKQKWTWSGDRKKKKKKKVKKSFDSFLQKGKGVYLPEEKIERLLSSEKGKKKLEAAERKKAKATREGEQYSQHGLAAGTSLQASMNKAFSPWSEANDLCKAVKKRDPRLARAGVSGYNKPKRTPDHPTKSHIVVAKEGDRIKTIRFGQQGKKVGTVSGTAGKAKKGESARMKAKRKSFKARHGKNIARGKMSAAYWADKVKW